MDAITVTIGATVPTGFEGTAAEEVTEKIGVDARISKDRGRIYFPITTDKLFQVNNQFIIFIVVACVKNKYATTLPVCLFNSLCHRRSIF